MKMKINSKVSLIIGIFLTIGILLSVRPILAGTFAQNQEGLGGNNNGIGTAFGAVNGQYDTNYQSKTSPVKVVDIVLQLVADDREVVANPLD